MSHLTPNRQRTSSKAAPAKKAFSTSRPIPPVVQKRRSERNRKIIRVTFVAAGVVASIAAFIWLWITTIAFVHIAFGFAALVIIIASALLSIPEGVEKLGFGNNVEPQEKKATFIVISSVIAVIGVVAWLFAAYDKQHSPFSLAAIEQVAKENGGRIRFDTLDVSTDEDGDEYFKDSGDFFKINEYGRVSKIEGHGILGWGNNQFEDELLGKHFTKEQIQSVRDGKTRCIERGRNELCVYTVEDGRYYGAEYKEAKKVYVV